MGGGYPVDDQWLTTPYATDPPIPSLQVKSLDSLENRINRQNDRKVYKEVVFILPFMRSNTTKNEVEKMEKHEISFDGEGYVCTCGSRYNSQVGANLHIEEQKKFNEGYEKLKEILNVVIETETYPSWDFLNNVFTCKKLMGETSLWFWMGSLKVVRKGQTKAGDMEDLDSWKKEEDGTITLIGKKHEGWRT